MLSSSPAGARSFAVFDTSENAGASMGIASGRGAGGVFTLTDDKGKPKMVFAVSENAPVLWVTDQHDMTSLAVDADGFYLYDRDGKTRRAALYRNQNGTFLAHWDANNKPRATLAMTKDGPGLFIFRENGTSIFSTPMP
jgi:hypothetical protein